MENTMDDVKQRVSENFDEVREELSERVQEIRDTVANYVDANPLAAVGIAFGVGYLLSGALFSRTTFKAVSIGGRFAVGGLLKQLVAGIGPGMIAAVMSGRDEESQSGGNGNRTKTQQH
jgi:hypothetical protein